MKLFCRSGSCHWAAAAGLAAGSRERSLAKDCSPSSFWPSMIQVGKLCRSASAHTAAIATPCTADRTQATVKPPGSAPALTAMSGPARQPPMDSIAAGEAGPQLICSQLASDMLELRRFMCHFKHRRHPYAASVSLTPPRPTHTHTRRGGGALGRVHVHISTLTNNSAPLSTKDELGLHLVLAGQNWCWHAANLLCATDSELTTGHLSCAG